MTERLWENQEPLNTVKVLSNKWNSKYDPEAFIKKLEEIRRSELQEKIPEYTGEDNEINYIKEKLPEYTDEQKKFLGIELNP